jgi:hypothetical protein
LATTGISNCELPRTSLVFQALMYIKQSFSIDSIIDFINFTFVTVFITYMVYLPEIRLMGSAGLMYSLLKIVVVDSAGDAS